MAETSRSQVTITLGRSGQVVKRASGDLDGTYSNLHTAVGRKSSIHDRLGTNVELNNKRHRGVGNGLGSSSAVGIDDLHLHKDDLRYKILRKSGNKLSENDGKQNGVDLREILSRSAQPSTSSLGMQQIMPKEKNGRQYIPDINEVRQVTPELRDVRQYIPEAREVRQRMPETRDVRERILETSDVRQRIPETRDARQRMLETREVRDRMPEIREVRERMPEVREIRQRMPDAMEIREQMPKPRGDRQRMTDLRDDRQRMPEARDARQRLPDFRDDRQLLLEPAGGSMMGRMPSTRDIDVMPQIDSLRNKYSPWALDHLRRRSPDGVFSSRGASPPRNVDESRRRPIIRSYDDVNGSTEYLSKDGLALARPMRTASFMAKPAVAAGPPKTVAPMLAVPPSSGLIAHKSSYTVDEQQTVEGLLHSLGLGKYVIYFKAEEVDMHALRQMRDNDLKELGIPMGPRKKILFALLPRSRWQM